MKRVFWAIVVFLLWTGRVQATDVTIGATTQPNFNPSGLAAAVTLTGVTVTNGTNAVLTCAGCFRPNWIGLTGFYITVGSNNYYVLNVDTTSQATLASGCPESSPATVVWHPYVEFRIYADRAFQPLGESYIVQPGTPGTGAWYKRYAASVVTSNGVKTLYIPEIIIDATTDAVGPTNQARYTAAFYRPDASLIQIYACADQFRVPPVTPTGWTSLCQFNSPPAIVPPANEAYTKSQIDARLISCSTSQMMYFAATGNQPACLNPGTNLTIAGGALNVTGVVTSVGLSLPNIFTVSNSPVTTIGTLTASLATQLANRVFAGPTTGAAAVPTFRSLVAGDIPTLPYVTSVGLSLPNIFTITNSPVTSTGSLTATLAGQSAKQFFAGPIYGTNTTGTPAFRAINEDDVPSVRQAVNAKTDYNCSGDATTTTGSMGSGAAIITSVGSLTGWKIGMGIRIVGAGTAGADLITIVQSITAPSTITVAVSAGTAVSGATIYHDDTACLVAAIAAAQASGGKKLYLPAGTYNTDAITGNVSGLLVEGDGPNRSIIKARATNQHVIGVTTPGYGYGLNLKDLGIRGAGKAAGSTGHCIFIKDSNSYLSEFKFDNLTVADCRQDGLNIPYIFSGVIERVSTDRIGEDHFDIGSVGGSNTVTLMNNYVKTIGAWRVGYRIRVAGAMMISNNGMAPDSESTAFWGLFGQKYVTANVTMTSGNATLTSVASGGGFNPGDEVWLANGVSAGVHLKTVVTAVNVAGNTVTLLNAPTNNGASVLGTTDGASSGAVMTSGNATLANVTNASDFVVGNGVYVTNGVSSGNNLLTTVSSIDVNANTITLAAAPTNNGPTIVAIDGTSYYRAAFLNNNIEDFGSYGIRLKEFSRLGSISGNNFLTSSAAINHIALKYDYAGAGFDNAGGGTTPAGFWDSSNVLTLQGGSWTNGQSIHSQAVPFLVAGESPKQYYETSFGFAVDLPALASSWDNTEQKMFLQIPSTGTQNLKLGRESAVTGKALFMNAANGNRLYLQAGTTSATTTFTLPTAVPAGNDYLLQGSTAGAWSWSNFTGTGNVVRATSPTLSTPIINSVVFANLPSSPNGTVILCTDCDSSGTGGSHVCTGGGPGWLALRIGGAWKCSK